MLRAIAIVPSLQTALCYSVIVTVYLLACVPSSGHHSRVPQADSTFPILLHTQEHSDTEHAGLISGKYTFITSSRFCCPQFLQILRSGLLHTRSSISTYIRLSVYIQCTLYIHHIFSPLHNSGSILSEPCALLQTDIVIKRWFLSFRQPVACYVMTFAL